MVRPIVFLPIICLLFGCGSAVAQSRGDAPVAWDGLGADPNARQVLHKRIEASGRHQDDPDITGALLQRPDWFPVLTAEEVEEEQRLQRAIAICRGC